MPLLASLTLDSLLENIQQFVVDAYDRMRADWTATGYWAGIWFCGFIVTFLLIRMMFTHWGDRDVTKKTIWLSLLVHTLIGMLSTTVIFPNVKGDPSSGGSVAIRRVVITHAADESDKDADDPSATAAGASRRSAWDEGPRFDGQGARRADMPRDQTGDELLVEKQPSKSDSVPLPDPQLAERTERDEQVPEPERVAEKMNARAELETPQIAEETADARPEAGGDSPRPKRQARGSSGGESVEIARGARPSRQADQSIPLDASHEGPEAGLSDETTPPLGDPADPATPGRPPRGTPDAAPVNDAAEISGSKDGSPAAGGSGRFTRMGRPKSGPDETGLPLLSRSGSKLPEELSELSPSGTAAGAAAAPTGPGGEGIGDALIPEILDSDAGAINKNGAKVPATYRLRSSPQRKKFAIDMGANEESEQAVESSLAWLAAHQNAKGYWAPIEATLGKEPDNAAVFNNLQERQRSGLQSHTGLTALAVLAFLGKGYTHEDNQYSETVDRALRWLISQQDAQGFLGGTANQYARMYCHGMATIALGEAYGMTKDPVFREPLARAIDFILSQQYPDGSWRYTDWRRLTTREGDMSMFGWQLMALKSAKTAGLAVPNATMIKAIDFLIAQGDHLKSRGMSQHGGLAAYRLQERPKPSMTAEALFCKQMLGIKRTNRASGEAVDYLLKNLPQRSKQDLYYWYYGTLAMYHHGGDAWRRWNEALRDTLIAEQRTDGDLAGSWNPRAPWGDYGGRVFSTALSTLCLEVYYRFLPLYQVPGSERLEQSSNVE